MVPDPPGWYRDPHRPGMRRYWDGRSWIDVDQVVDRHPDPPSPRAGHAPRLVAQRRPEGGSPAPADPVDEVDTAADDASPPGGPEPLSG